MATEMFFCENEKCFAHIKTDIERKIIAGKHAGIDYQLNQHKYQFNEKSIFFCDICRNAIEMVTDIQANI